MFTWCSGLFLTIVSVLLMEWSDRPEMHSASFYIAFSLTMPMLLTATAVAGRFKWPATTAALVYLVVFAGTSWVLMLFPATPRLGPIYRDITHYVPLDFPVLLFIPAFVVDVVWTRVKNWPRFRAGAVLGVAYIITLLAVQWPFASFVMSHGRNWFFHADNFVYWQSVPTEHFAFEFRRPRPGDTPLALGLLYAVGFAVISSSVGIMRGRWMTRVQR
jgi:uncharacterized membrane protein